MILKNDHVIARNIIGFACGTVDENGKVRWQGTTKHMQKALEWLKGNDIELMT